MVQSHLQFILNFYHFEDSFDLVLIVCLARRGNKELLLTPASDYNKPQKNESPLVGSGENKADAAKYFHQHIFILNFIRSNQVSHTYV